MHRASLRLLIVVLAVVALGSGAERAALQTAAADLAVTINQSSADFRVFSVGDIIMMIPNSGPGPAEGVQLSAVFPLELQVMGVMATPGTCTGMQSFTCSFPTISPGASATVRATVIPREYGFFSIGATVTAMTSDPNPGNNSTSSMVFVDATSADVATSIMLDRATVSVGGSVTGTVTVANAGPGSALEVLLFVRVPIGFSPALASVSATGTATLPGDPPPGMCRSLGSNTQVCNAGDIPPGAQRVATLAWTTSAAVTGTIDATSSPGGPDPNPANNTVSAMVTVTAEKTDVALESKTASDSSVLVGDVVTYTFDIRVSGTSPATNVILVDDMSLGVRLEPPVPPGCVLEMAGRITCRLGTLAIGTHTVRIRVRPETVGVLGNTATVRADNDANPGNNTASASVVVVPPLPDLQPVITGAPTSVMSGERSTIAGLLRNNSPTVAADVRLVFACALPNCRVENVWAEGFACRTAVPPIGGVTCDRDELPGNGQVQWTADLHFMAPGMAMFSVMAFPGGNGAQVPVAVVPGRSRPEVDVELVSKVDEPDPVRVNGRLEYLVTVRNNSRFFPATNVFLQDILPSSSEVAFRSAVLVDPRVPGGELPVDCTRLSQSNVLVCRLGTLEPTAMVTIKIVVTALRAGEIRNDARVIAREPDPVANNEKSATTTVLGP